MKVLLANTTCKVGGVSTFMLSLRAALIAQGHECDLFFFERGTMERHLPRDCRPHFGTLADCMRVVAREHIDVVHANNADWQTGITAVRQLGVRLVVTAHKVRDSAWTYGWTAGNCDAFVAVSNWIRESLQPLTDTPIQVVHNGIDTTHFYPTERPDRSPPIVAWVGRGAAPVKRLDAFAAIAPALRRAGLRVWVIDQQGADKFAETCPEPAHALRSAAELWQGASLDEMPSVYRQVAASGGCIVSTSRMEGLGLALIEAQACGCLVVAADVQGVNECVSPHHGGVLYRLDTRPEDLTTLIRNTLQDRESVRLRQREAAAYAHRHFNVTHMTERYVGIYADAPYPSEAPLLTRATRQLRLSPALHWDAYLEHRLGVGYGQYAASQELAARGEWRIAAAAARASFRTAPTMYVRPERLTQLVRLHLQARGEASNDSPGDAHVRA